MAITTIDVKVYTEIVFDPPDCGLGWYVDVYTQIGNDPRTGERFGPFEHSEIKRIAGELLAEYKQLMRRIIDSTKNYGDDE